MSGRQHGELNEISPAAKAANANANALTGPPIPDSGRLTATRNGRRRRQAFYGSPRPVASVRSRPLPGGPGVTADPHPGVGADQPGRVPQVGVRGTGFDDRRAGG